MDAAQQKRILGYFLQETQEHLATLQQAIAAMAQPLGDQEQVSDWFRAAHSIKGGAAMLGLEPLQQMALRLEDCLKILRDQAVERNLHLTGEMVALFQQGVTALAGLVTHLEQEGSIPWEMGQEVVREHQTVFIQLEALLHILVQGEGVTAGWDATVPDVPVIAPEPDFAEAGMAAESEELDLVGLFASLDAQAVVPEAVAAEAPVLPTNTTQELASLAELFSLAPEEGGTGSLDDDYGRLVEGEQTVEDLGALADLFTLGEEGQATADPEDFSFLAAAGNGEAMALEALSQLEPLPGVDVVGLDSEHEFGEFSFESFESVEGLEPASDEFGFAETLADIPALDFSGETGGDLGEFSFASFEPEESLELEEESSELDELTLSSDLSDLSFSETLADIPALDFSGETGGDLGEFSFASFEPEESLELEEESSELDELTLSSDLSDLSFSETLADIPTLDFSGETGGDLGEFSFASFESVEGLEPASDELSFAETLADIPTLDFSGETGGDLGEFSFASFEPEELSELEEESPELDELTLSSDLSDLSFSETLADIPTLDFSGETGEDLGEFSFASFEPEEFPELGEESPELDELTLSSDLSDLSFSETLADIPILDFSGETGEDLGEFSFDDVSLDTENLEEFTFADVTEIPDELNLTSSGLLGDAGTDLAATLSAFAREEEGVSQSENADLATSPWADMSLEPLDQEIGSFHDLPVVPDLGAELDFDSSGTDTPDTFDLAGDLELPDLPDLSDLGNLELASQGEDFFPESNFGDLEQLLADVPDLPNLDSLEQDLAVSPAMSTTPPGAAAEPTPAMAEPRSGAAVEQNVTMRVPIRQLDNLSNLIGELVVSRNTLNEDQNQLRQFLENLLHQAHQLNDLSQRMQDLYERSLLEGALNASRGGSASNFLNLGSNGSQHSTGAEFDALEMDRFTGFHTLSQEIAERVLRVRESAQDIGFMVEAFDEVVRSFQRITQGLQEGINNARMEPFSRVTDRLPRAVRNVALKCGKQVTLEIEGRETLVDKMILEKLTDPMTHLVNNAIVHGIGLPAQRQAAGQSTAGRIVIRAAYQGNQTVITVSDDGVGINPDRVKAKAIEKGVITPDVAATMGKQDIYQLLFAAGFSTKDQADEFAGRGVGLDVVRSNLAEIRGTVVVDSELGKGTTFTIRLPLTLSISKSLPCVVNHALVAFPMDGVADVPVDVTQEMIHVGTDGKTVLDWAGQRIPLLPLSELLRYGRLIGRGNIYGTSTQEGISVVVINSLGRYVAFQVDQVLNEQEVVIKQLSGPVHKPLGIAGATILGDGRIMMIADILELADLALGQMPPPNSPLWHGIVPAEPETTDEPTVLIVDDSIVVREMLSMTFSNKGYRVEQARDGQEAWEKLRDGLPCDLMFCDIEMPRMDGLELLSKVRRDGGLKGLPIAMLTSRGAERHRQMAIQLGANAYFTKPYLEETLLEAARRLLTGESLVTPSN